MYVRTSFSLVSFLALALVTACSSSDDSAAAASGGSGGNGGAGGDPTVVTYGGAAGAMDAGGSGGSPMASPGSSGVYVVSPQLSNGGPTVPDATYALTDFDGVLLRVRWDSFEPTSDTYDFYELDSELLRASQAGKKVAIALLAGTYTPSWIYDSGGATELVFVIAGAGQVTSPGSTMTDCRTLHIPEPWDAGYQTELTKAITTLGAHLSMNPSAQTNLRMVLMSGINTEAEDIELPTGAAGMTPSGCVLTDATVTWSSVGYRPSKMITAFSSMLSAYQTAFPSQLLVMPTAQHAFPGIGDDGKLADADSVDPTPSMVAAGVAALSTSFGVQGSDLTADETDPYVSAGKTAGSVVGFRSNDFLGINGAGCGSDLPDTATMCTDAGFGDILGNGIEQGAKFLMVDGIDITQCPMSIENAQEMLLLSGM